MKKFLKTGLGMLCCALVVCIVLAFCGMLVNTAGSKVTFQKIDMDAFYTEMYKDSAYKPSRLTIGENKDGMVNATLTGYLYMPKGVSESNPAPAVVLTHGYLNSKEYIEPFAIELARRGIIAFVYDQYDHGTSTWDTPAAFNFFMYSAYDAATWMSQQSYVLKGADGAAMVGATGHSMGGFSSEIAAAYDAADVFAGQAQKMVAVLPMGADFRYSGAIYTAYGNRTAGALASEYDEFFFNNSDSDKKGTVVKKNYLADKVGMALLGITEEGVNKQWYIVDPTTGKAYEGEVPEVGYGERIIYNEKGDHPYNTWSPEAVGDVCDFYGHAFTYQAKLHGTNYTASTKKGSAQIWELKEVFTCLSLLALIIGIIAAICVTAKVPFLKLANTEENKGLYDGSIEVKQSGSKKAIATIVSAASIGFGFYFLTTLMDRNADGLATLNIYTKFALIVAAFAIALIGIAYLVVKSKEDNEKAKTIFGRIGVGLAILVITLFAFKWIINDGASVIANIGGNKWFNAPSVNTIVYWAMAAGIMGLVFAVVSTLVSGSHEVKFVDALGVRANIKQIGIALLKGLALCLVTFLFIFLIGVIFKTDFRVYTYAFKAQMAGIAWKSWLRYVPLFFIFYLTAGMSISAATVGKKGWKADLVAVLIEVLPSALFLLYQYTVLETTGTAPYINFALNGILVQGLIPTLIFLAVIQRRSLEKTGNIWTGVFFNTFFFTLITISNTTLYNLAK